MLYLHAVTKRSRRYRLPNQNSGGHFTQVRKNVAEKLTNWLMSSSS
ncbi:conserved hypothetical protein [Vibrio cholerae O1 str. 2010EL-1786]|uniref:Uncharacterized protein n=2 Tax=Vibrio cholerae TaxID=666 RepID=A0A0X1L085_VIBCO|nr:hypothetical protein VC0395_0577 [Vibrio cholerae O395]AET28739.1 conserved hypothetical protein [Vibrio cholerae O1 str. 2010EL-1786]APF51019.1 hypothetical protein ASZ80_03524 [Vibrio cholerae]EAZ72270.1 hypothetical protein A5C_A0817 [Vibrio cholerae NCTC 8457]EET23913.1 conserved hypothetical protein [Vibrio cholerae MO10]EGR05356.1 hypothetical protein VCHC49A2_0564 [Vibrio cholerae HC-49A2]EHH84594.1 hypothetical protein VCHC23A1_2361 [Vibrio cholerae HC-23A1]EHI07470.1 hypothetical